MATNVVVVVVVVVIRFSPP